MASTEKSINQLPTISNIEPGNFVIVQTENATNKLDYKDFIIGLENTTFSNTVNKNTTDITALSGVLYATPTSESIATADYYVPINIAGTTYKIMLKQA